MNERLLSRPGEYAEPTDRDYQEKGGLARGEPAGYPSPSSALALTPPPTGPTGTEPLTHATADGMNAIGFYHLASFKKYPLKKITYEMKQYKINIKLYGVKYLKNTKKDSKDAQN